MKINRRFLLLGVITFLSFESFSSDLLNKSNNYISKKNELSIFSEFNGWIIDHKDINNELCGERYNFDCFKFTENKYDKNLIFKILDKLKFSN